MSKTNRNLKMLGLVIKRLEEDSHFIDRLEEFLAQKNISDVIEASQPIPFDVFDEFSKNGRVSLEAKLGTVDETQLKSIIREHGLDSKKLAQKWKSKDRLINLVLDRVEARVEKGNVFLNFGKEKNIDQ